MLDYSGWASGVQGLGPGRRVVVWIRGCNIGCSGCMTPELWESGEARAIEPLAEELLEALKDHDGLSISGGEPFAQPQAVFNLIELLRQSADIEVLAYSGYLYERLLESATTKALVESLDILIDGPYIADAPSTLQWRGSDNQRVLLLSDRAKQSYQSDLPAKEPRQLQIQILQTGKVKIIGLPRRGEYIKMRSLLEMKGMIVGEQNT